MEIKHFGKEAAMFVSFVFLLSACHSSKEKVEESMRASMEASLKSSIEASLRASLESSPEASLADSFEISEKEDSIREEASERIGESFETETAPDLSDAPGGSFDKTKEYNLQVKEIIEGIRKIYAKTRDGNYRDMDGRTYDGRGVVIKAIMEVQDQTFHLYAGYDQRAYDTLSSILKKAGYKNAYIEFYYGNKEAESGLSYSDKASVAFVYMRIDGMEFRYYFDDYGNFVRRIDPEGSWDHPDRDWFSDSIYTIGCYIRDKT